MDDYNASAKLCEERGFQRQGDLLRSVARGTLQLFTVIERPFNGDYLEEEGGTPLALHLNREEAEGDALRRNVRALRERDLRVYTGDYLEIVTELDLAEFERRIGEILEVEYALPDSETHQGPFFPESATDAQLRAILELLRIRFFDVTEVAFGG